MKKLLVYICSLLVVLMFVSCQTPEKAPLEASKPEKASVPVSINLNGKWKFASEWSDDWGRGTWDGQFEIVQKGAEIMWTGFPYGDGKNIGTLEKNILHMEPIAYDDLHAGGWQTRIELPARDYKISQDGNTMTSKYNYFGRGAVGGTARGNATVTCIRE